MSKYAINDTTLTAIADSIRAKGGTSDPIQVSNFASAIANLPTGGGLPPEALVITGDCSYRFAGNGWNWFIENYGNQITTENISNASYMFYNNTITTVPFDLNFIDGGCDSDRLFNNCKISNISSIDFKQTSQKVDNYMFYACMAQEIGTLKNLYPSGMNYFFSNCNNLRNLPTFENLDLSYIHSVSGSVGNMFSNCYSLRNIPSELLKELYSAGSYLYQVCYHGFSSDYALDEIIGIPICKTNVTVNMFSSTFAYCSRIKNVIFDTNDDGSAKTANWKSQTIDLSTFVGYASSTNYILHYNSGITGAKYVGSAETYEALKDDPDWFTVNVAYSRYNHDSAVATINSLPDTSAYLATTSGTNTIKFKGDAGSATDGGAINTLTEEEIAVATAKGWTVAFV